MDIGKNKSDMDPKEKYEKMLKDYMAMKEKQRDAEIDQRLKEKEHHSPHHWKLMFLILKVKSTVKQ